MKKLLLSFLSILLPLMAGADPVEINGFNFILDTESMTAELKGPSGNPSDEITIPGIVPYGEINYTVTSIGENAFFHCVNVKSITIPSSVKKIGNGAFSSCISLASMNIPVGVTSIGEGAFKGCKEMISVTIPLGVTEISKELFHFVSPLKKFANIL